MGWNEPYIHVETVQVLSVTRTVTAPRRYSPGSGDLVIFYNGLYAVRGKDYNELTPFSVQFNYDLEPGDTVVLHYQKLW